ncbi:HD domain-containing protein [Clostridium aestuarii]|uniref:HD domain-containing protein n=1 Tax=Clostridium aestuarii TaxID=338193 RepID=A0ABT4D2Q6_9CLOT|nr:HD domain-containing protein [Clostridium aestuarii]MCY6485514.1 HD domain-containing protein [Clostridium aestuarii]
MKREEFQRIESFMLKNMNDTVHDCLHVYRVLNYAIQIADTIEKIDTEVVIISALLHDIGRVDEIRNPSLCHAKIGSKKAKEFLINNGYSEGKANHVADCILTHRYKKNLKPQTMEAKIIFDADKLDLTGTVGTARAILFGGQIEEPLYLVGDDRLPTKGLPSEEASLFREYNRKLNKLFLKLNTEKAKEIGIEQQKTMDSYFMNLFKEVNRNYSNGKKLMDKILE